MFLKTYQAHKRIFFQPPAVQNWTYVGLDLGLWNIAYVRVCCDLGRTKHTYQRIRDRGSGGRVCGEGLNASIDQLQAASRFSLMATCRYTLELAGGGQVVGVSSMTLLATLPSATGAASVYKTFVHCISISTRHVTAADLPVWRPTGIGTLLKRGLSGGPPRQWIIPFYTDAAHPAMHNAVHPVIILPDILELPFVYHTRSRAEVWMQYSAVICSASKRWDRGVPPKQRTQPPWIALAISLLNLEFLIDGAC